MNADTGALAAIYEYSPFGEPLRAQTLDLTIADNPFRFSTKYCDLETGLVYYGYRFYDPHNGRFINRDPIEEQGGLNLYGFCGNNAVNRWDVLGDIAFQNETRFAAMPALTITPVASSSSYTGPYAGDDSNFVGPLPARPGSTSTNVASTGVAAVNSTGAGGNAPTTAMPVLISSETSGSALGIQAPGISEVDDLKAYISNLDKGIDELVKEIADYKYDPPGFEGWENLLAQMETALVNAMAERDGASSALAALVSGDGTDNGSGLGAFSFGFGSGQTQTSQPVKRTVTIYLDAKVSVEHGWTENSKGETTVSKRTIGQFFEQQVANWVSRIADSSQFQIKLVAFSSLDEIQNDLQNAPISDLSFVAMHGDYVNGTFTHNVLIDGHAIPESEAVAALRPVNQVYYCGDRVITSAKIFSGIDSYLVSIGVIKPKG